MPGHHEGPPSAKQARASLAPAVAVVHSAIAMASGTPALPRVECEIFRGSAVAKRGTRRRGAEILPDLSMIALASIAARAAISLPGKWARKLVNAVDQAAATPKIDTAATVLCVTMGQPFASSSQLPPPPMLEDADGFCRSRQETRCQVADSIKPKALQKNEETRFQPPEESVICQGCCCGCNEAGEAETSA